MLQKSLELPGERIDFRDAVDLVAEKFHPDGGVVRLCGKNFHHIAVHAEFVSHKIDVVPLVLDFDQLFQKLVPVFLHPGPQGNHHGAVIDRVAQAVNAGNAGNNNDIPPLRKGRSGRMPQLVDFVVDGGILFNIGVCRRNIGLRLVIIVVADEILDGVLREKFPKLGTELGRQRFVVGENERRAVHPRDHVRHSKRFSGARHAQQRLLFVAALQTLYQLLDRLRLIAGRLILGYKFKIHRNLRFFRLIPAPETG